MTNNMKAFIAQNKKHRIVEGFRITPIGKEAKTATELSNSNIKYIFKNGSSVILTAHDIASAPDYQPVWAL